MNPTLTKCSACGNQCRKRFGAMVGGRGAGVGYIVETAIILLLAHFFLPKAMSLALVVLIAIPLIFAVDTACDRLYHAYWLWRHPARCGGGGHYAPAHSKL